MLLSLWAPIQKEKNATTKKIVHVKQEESDCGFHFLQDVYSDQMKNWLKKDKWPIPEAQQRFETSKYWRAQSS